ncbi:MAG TPA: sigma factor-like helix-turn-helix DNA-binding protein, partial [Thermoanaerobaculia bacterium]|nr:sigma factor-like helix-turn-helix DNA-binding protein [Thermoanaerobaculia bacterium]
LYRHADAGRYEELRSNAWLRRVVYTTCIDVIRERARQREEELAVEPVAPAAGHLVALPADPERQVLGRELERVLAGGIADLPERLRSVVVARLGDASYRQVAERLLITEANARKRMQEARAVLGRRVAAYHRGTPPPPPAACAGRRPAEVESTRCAARDEVLAADRAVRGVVVRLPAGVECERWVALAAPPSSADPLAERRRLEDYVRSHPRGWKRRCDLADRLLLDGEPEAAVVQWEEVVARRPRLPRPWLRLVRALRYAEREAAAADACERGAEACGVPLASRLLATWGATLRGDEPRWEREHAALADAARGSALPWRLRADHAERHGRPGAVIAAVDAALGCEPEDAAMLTRGWRELALAGRGAEVSERAERALALDADHLPALLAVETARVRRGEGGASSDEPSPRWRAVERWAAERADAASVVAFAELRAGRTEAARRRLESFADRHPRRRQAWAALATFCDLLGDRRAALAAVDRLAPLGGGRGEELLALRIRGRAGDQDGAKRALRALLTSEGDVWEVAATGAAALLASGAGCGPAVELSCRAVEAAGELPAAWVAHGRLLAAGGRRAEAAEALRRGLELLPDEAEGELPVAALAALCELEVADERGGDLAHRLGSRVERLRGADPVAGAVWADALRRQLGTPALPSDLPASALAVERRRIFTHSIVEPSFP